MTAPLSFQKPKRLIEEVEKDPLYVIKEVFSDIDRDFLREILRKWLFRVLTNSHHPYNTKEQQLQLLFFHDQLLSLIDALFFVTEKKEPEQEILNQLRAEMEKYNPCNQFIPEKKDERLAVKTFYRLFTIEYVRSELWDWLVTAVLSNDEKPEGLDREAVIWAYEWVQYLTEAAFQIVKK